MLLLFRGTFIKHYKIPRLYLIPSCFSPRSIHSISLEWKIFLLFTKFMDNLKMCLCKQSLLFFLCFMLIIRDNTWTLIRKKIYHKRISNGISKVDKWTHIFLLSFQQLPLNYSRVHGRSLLPSMLLVPKQSDQIINVCHQEN